MTLSGITAQEGHPPNPAHRALHAVSTDLVVALCLALWPNQLMSYPQQVLDRVILTSFNK